MTIRTYAQIQTESDDVDNNNTDQTSRIDAVVQVLKDIGDTVQSVVGGVGSRIDNLAIANLGAGNGIFATHVSDTFNLKSLIAGSNITLTPTANDITIASTGEANTASNLGTGSALFSGKVGVDLQFKSLKVSGALGISSDATSVTLSYTDVDTVTSVASVGAGASVFQSNTAGAVTLRSIIGTGLISATQNANDITIATTAEINTASNLGAGTGIWVSKVASDLRFKSLIVGGTLTISNTATDITITDSVKEYIHASMSAAQTTSLAATNHIQFDTADINNVVTVSSGAGQAKGIFTLTANKKYRLMCAFQPDWSAANGAIEMTCQWRNITANTLIGIQGQAVGARTNSTSVGSQATASAVIAPGVTTTVQVEIISASGTPTSIVNTKSYVWVMEI